MSDSKLAPHAGKMTETSRGEVPVDKINLPPGFSVQIWATGLPGGRAMARGDQGKIYVGTRIIGRVYEVTDNGDRRSVRVVADKLTQPAGVAFANGSLYVMAINRVLRYDGIESNPNVQPVDLTDKFQLPPEQHHNWKYIRFGPDKKLYVPFGAPCNICEPPPQYAQIRRYNPDGSGMEVIARGIRNSVGFDWHPKTGELWFTDHGRDWMGDDGPQDELNRLSKPGAFFGFPYCHAQGVPDADFKKADACKDVTKPVALMGPHAAAMGVLVLHRQHVPGRVQGHAVRRAQGLVEPLEAVRVRRREHQGRRRRQEPEDHAVHDRLHRCQGRQVRLLGPAGVPAADARRRAARVRRAERDDLPGELLGQELRGGKASPRGGGRSPPPFLFPSRRPRTASRSATPATAPAASRRPPGRRRSPGSRRSSSRRSSSCSARGCASRRRCRRR